MTHLSYRFEGIVQGVGFRPFIYMLALKHNLTGFVLNDSMGVEASIEGEILDIEAFEQDILTKLPPLARIDKMAKSVKVCEYFESFSIHESLHVSAKYSFVSPDFAMCADCLNELRDPQNRRHNYFFINCTNCGPRYSIIKTVPYDRSNTSMKNFVMCEECEKEYTNPQNRRYHAQPISCEKCGPTLSLYHIDGKKIATNYEAIKRLAMLIKTGHIVAMKGMGGFHLMCDAKNSDTIALLREKKHRPTKPFALMFASIAQIAQVCQMSEAEKAKICSQERPIVLVKKDMQNYDLSELIAPNIDRLGVFLAYTPLHVLLLEYLQNPIIATSANHTGEPIITQAKGIQEKLTGIVEYFLDYNREILNASDDSVLQMIGEKTLMMRSSRGITPLSMHYPNACTQKVLALGAHQKNAIALYMNEQIILSPYIGDLDNIATVDFFEKTLQTFKSFYDFEPDIIICDKHPLYETTKWAKKQNKPIVQVQHHYSHILSGMLEHNLDEKVLGIAWDGTGYGDDGTIWGGEFFLCDRVSYERVARFESFALLGGEASIKDIKRIALSVILDLAYEPIFEQIFKRFEQKELALLRQMHQKKINSPQCNAVGRLFDLVSVICGVCDKVSYDGESGLILENLYDVRITQSYDFYLQEGIIYYKHTVKEMFKDAEPSLIASKFINALINCCLHVSTKYDLAIVLSGGVFQNRTIVTALEIKLKRLYFQNRFAINDGGIALGQLTHFLAKF
ncbi:MAG: carbamoyltransferase HypF [Sulfurospirillum sp.]|nr:carbamoyltransferase HypF [Sulfurospirillum sp.]